METRFRGGSRLGVAPAVATFLYLQMLDFATTVIGLSLGLSEASPLVRSLISVSPVLGVLAAKIAACFFVVYCVARSRLHVLRWANYWFAALVAWNLLVILWRLHSSSGSPSLFIAR